MRNFDKSQFFVGVDGGASKCHVRIEDADGNLVGEATGGPANIRLSINEAWESIFFSINQVLESKKAKRNAEDAILHVGMGLAGCEVKEAYQAFCQTPHPFQTLQVTSDSHTACLGAHDGADGGIIIAGTGVVGLQIENKEMTKVGGWGFPHDDEGGGAWLGLQAVKITLQWLDKRLPKSSLAEAIYLHFNRNEAALVHWAHAANSTRFATLAPFVIEHLEKKDEVAIDIMHRAAAAINQIGDTLLRLQKNQTRVLPIALIGGVTKFLEPHLNQSLRDRICVAKKTPASGAIQLIRNYVACKETYAK